MKKTFWIPWLLLSIALSGSAYSVSDPVSDEPQQSLPGESGKNDADDNRGEPGGRNLGACCLRTGNTERMARSIRSASDSDLIVVEPKPLYEADYNAMPERAQAKLGAIAQGDFPPITISAEALEDCDMHFAGSPIWFRHMASPMQTFRHENADRLATNVLRFLRAAAAAGSASPNGMRHRLVHGAVFEESLLLTSGSLGSMETRMAPWLDKPEASPHRASRCQRKTNKY